MLAELTVPSPSIAILLLEAPVFDSNVASGILHQLY